MGISVLHVLHAYRPGGMENMIAQMAWRLPVPEFNVAICALTEADAFKDRLPTGTPVLEMKKNQGLDIGCVLRLRQLIKRLQPDVVHSHNWNALIYSILAIGGRRTALLHGEHALLYTWERSPWRLRLRRALYTRCDVVHTVSQGQADELTALGICSGVELRVIRNGVDTRKFCPGDKAQSRSALGIPEVGPCIGMVARCVPEKRHELLIEAFGEVAATFPGVTLVLAGAGGMCEAAVRAMVAVHPFARRIVWLGHRNDMPAVYNALDLMVLTSTSEGMSNVSLEAMSCGVPVLMDHTCGSEELIVEGVNGRAAPMRNAHEVAASIASLLASQEELLRMGRAARATVELGHPLEKTAADYASVYRQLALRDRPKF
jgi:glycosyltransferase involved in cell wall biosynthesis